MKAPGDPTPLVRFLSPTAPRATSHVTRSHGASAPTLRATAPAGAPLLGDNRGPRASPGHGRRRRRPPLRAPGLPSPGGRSRLLGPVLRGRRLCRRPPVRHVPDRGSETRHRPLRTTGALHRQVRRRPAPRRPPERCSPRRPAAPRKRCRLRDRLPHLAPRRRAPTTGPRQLSSRLSSRLRPTTRARSPQLRRPPTLHRPRSRMLGSRLCASGSGWPRRMMTTRTSGTTPMRGRHRPLRRPAPELLHRRHRKRVRCPLTPPLVRLASCLALPDTPTPQSSRRCRRPLTSRPSGRSPRRVPRPLSSGAGPGHRSWARPAGRAKPASGCPGSTRGR